MNLILSRYSILLIIVAVESGYAFANGLNEIFAGVDTVYCNNVSPILGLTESIVPIVVGDELTSTFPATAAVASVSGPGYAVATGQEGFFNDDKIILFDNLRFATNVIAWLDQLDRKRVMIVTNHDEWCGYSTTILQNRLTQLGYTVTLSHGAITAAKLQDIGVLFVGNLWGNITDEEITAISQFHESGGGLFLMGVGWSWLPYHPGTTLDDYPMNRIGALCGIRWINASISDNAHTFNSGTLFLHFYPDTGPNLCSVPAAISYINTVTSANVQNLGSVLQSWARVRARYCAAHSFLAQASSYYPAAFSFGQQIFDFYISFVETYPQYFQKGFWYSAMTESALLQIRERVHRTLGDVLPLTSAVKQRIASALNLTGRYLDLWNDFSLQLMDNSRLAEEQKDFLYRYLSSLPPGLHNLRVISVSDYLGPSPPAVNLSGSGGGVNIIYWPIGSANENSFPNDVMPVYTDVFCLVVAHEVNHVVNAFTIGNNPILQARQSALIAAAGNEPLNYLRSMCGSGFFTGAPQEFFASIANQWFDDSWQTMRLGLVRFTEGRTHPLDQALFFADVYSKGSDSTFFYRIDTKGLLTRETIPLTRDGLGHINGIRFDGLWYNFELDNQGNVLEVAVPVQLAFFEVAAEFGNGVTLRWKTLSETNNYGYQIQKSKRPPEYRTIPGVFIRGHGTTLTPQEYTWKDASYDPEYYYRLQQIDLDGSIHFSEGVKAAKSIGASDRQNLPSCFSLEQNYPNPFNAATRICFALPEPSIVSLVVYDASGRQASLLANGTLDAGYHAVTWHASNMASGVYFARLKIADKSEKNVFAKDIKLILTK